LLDAGRRLLGYVYPPEWEFAPKGWRSVEPGMTGWNTSGIIEAESNRWDKVVAALADPSPLCVSHESPSVVESGNVAFHNIVMSFGYVLGRATWEKSSISVLDWGGGIGYDDIVVVQTALIGEADVICTKDDDFYDPGITRFLTRVGISVMDDVTLMQRMRY